VAGSVAMIVASLDLELVRLLRGAMAGGGVGPGRGIWPTPAIEPRVRYHPTPRIEPRPVIHPTPRIEPRLVYRPHRIEPPACPAISTSADAQPTHTTHLQIQPPWKILPWQNPPPPAPKLKIAFKQPDVLAKGTIFDVFV